MVIKFAIFGKTKKQLNIKSYSHRWPSYVRIVLLMFAGESIFLLPFLLARIFRPTFLAVFEINNFELGALYSTYGVIALLSYLYGGTIADRFDPRKLMATALLLTAAGGFVLAQYPSYAVLQVLYGYWGFSTIFLFWAAMIKATRGWGGLEKQGQAFGLLEGGRGIVAASIGAVGVLIFALFLPEQVKTASFIERQHAFQTVIYFTTFLIIGIALLIYFFLKDEEGDTRKVSQESTHSWKHILKVMRIPSVGLLIVIVLCAYVGYKVTDILSLYAAEIMLFNEVDAAKVGSYQMYLRPIVCISIGFFADRSSSSIWLIRGFLVLFFGAAIFASGLIIAPLSGLFIVSVIITGIGTYGLRTLYFAAIQEGGIPFAVTGTAVGIISVVGYTPDIFMGPLMGFLLDNNSGIKGHQLVFTVLASFALCGGIAAYFFQKLRPNT